MKEMSVATKQIVYKSDFTLVFTYGCDAWSITSKVEIRVRKNEVPPSSSGNDRAGLHEEFNHQGQKVEPMMGKVIKAQPSWYGLVR